MNTCELLCMHTLHFQLTHGIVSPKSTTELHIYVLKGGDPESFVNQSDVKDVPAGVHGRLVGLDVHRALWMAAR